MIKRKAKGRRGRRDTDPATRYAKEVVTGKSIAGDAVKEACERHLNDLENSRCLWKPERGARFAKFCEFCCVVEHPVTTRLVPFRLLPWQAFIAYSIFSWTVPENDRLKRLPGTRRFRHAYIETGKGSGKSPLGAAFALYFLTADIYEELDGTKHPQMEPQCYAVASTFDQAVIVAMNPAAQMVSNSDYLQDKAQCVVKGGSKPDRIISLSRGGVFQAVSTNWGGHGKAGLRVNFIQAEELHEQTDRVHIDNLEAGFKGRPQPLLLMLTNAGKHKEGIAWDEHRRALSANRTSAMDNYFSYVAQCDDDDYPTPGANRRWHPIKRVWKKANPSLGLTVRQDYIHDRIAKAKYDPDRQEVLRLNFGRWGTIDSDYISWRLWKRVECAKFDDSELEGATLHLGGDLAELHDLTALAGLFECRDGKLRLRVWSYTANGTLDERDETSSGHLRHWANEGWIETVDGEVLNYDIVAARIKALTDQYETSALAMDPYHSSKMQDALDKADVKWWAQDAGYSRLYQTGLEIVKHPQGFFASFKADARKLTMNGSIGVFERLVKAKQPRIMIERNPVLRWNLNSAIITKDAALNRKFDKRRSELNNHGKIDGLVASVMAVGLTERPPEDKITSPWEDPDYTLD